GASRGIGRATVLALAKPGSTLVLAARDEDALRILGDEVTALGAQAVPILCDITSETQVQQTMSEAAAITGRIDVLINSAGGAVIAPFEQLALEQWEHALRTLLTGTFLACKYAAPHMGRGGLIVNVASVAARSAFPGWAAYSAAKFGVLGFTNAMREELRERGVRVSAVLPAATDTTLWDALPGDWSRANMLQAEDVGRAIAGLVGQPSYMATEELVIGHVAGRL
ncbi:MAG: SDR family oxidoreductase, partial [Roseiflexaceae bacterium]|nr:SDR family oxidoreductase [Roseiflexaceae bacterium]